MLPVVFIATLSMLLMGLYVYQKVVLYYVASTAAERSAYRWGNSYWLADGGAAPPGQYDGLYWRLAEDQMLESLFGMSVDESRQVQMKVPLAGSADTNEQDKLSYRKLANAAGWIPGNYDGRMLYDRRLLLKAVAVELQHNITLTPIAALVEYQTPQVQASAVIVDPTEFIRSVDLVRYYASKFKGNQDEKAVRLEAAAVLRRRQQAGGAADD